VLLANILEHTARVKHKRVSATIYETRTLAQFVAQIQFSDLPSSLRVVMRGAPRIVEERHAVRAPQGVMGGQYSLLYCI